MQPGHLLTSGEIQKYFVNETELWAGFNYVFSDACRKRSTYKFGLIKAILDNLFSVEESPRGMELSFTVLFGKFAENYWNIVTKYHLKQIRSDGKSDSTKLENIFAAALEHSGIAGVVEFDSLAEQDRNHIIEEVAKQCRKNVVGALYNDFDGVLYGFDLKDTGIWINPVAYEFMLKFKIEIEQLNYYAWAKFMERINTDDAIRHVLSKLELATPQRQDLSIYRKILQEEFESNNCFYCGKKLGRSAHVDHVIPWTFMKSDHLWNFVLACPACNTRKNDRLPNKANLSRVVTRNEDLLQSKSQIVREEFVGYNANLLWTIWNYAKLSGFRVSE